MAQLLDCWRACDGFNARCALFNGETITFHWPTEPADVQAASDILESEHLAWQADQNPQWEVVGSQP